MFQFQPFTQAELDADPRIKALVEDKRRLLLDLRMIATNKCLFHDPELAAQVALEHQEATERQREAAHLAAVQAENVRRGWRPATFREILGEPWHDAQNEEHDP